MHKQTVKRTQVCATREKDGFMKGYTIAFIIGVLSSVFYPVEEIHAALEIVGVLMLVALFASLLVPFAAFSAPERWNSFILQYAPLIAFGAYGVVVAFHPSVVKVVIMMSAMAMHISYWSSGLHSRNYRMEQWRTGGFCRTHPATSRIISVYNGSGHAELGDLIVRGVFSGNPLSPAAVKALKDSPHYNESLRQELGDILP